MWLFSTCPSKNHIAVFLTALCAITNKQTTTTTETTQEVLEGKADNDCAKSPHGYM